MNYHFLIIIITILVSLSHGQVNIEQYRSKEIDGLLEKKFYEHVNLSTSIRRSTSSLFSLGIKYFKPIITKGYEGFFISKLNYGESNSDTYLNNSFYHFRLIAIENSSAFGIPEVYFQYESNEFTLTNTRYLAGMGLRYKFFDTVGGTSVMNEWYKENDATPKTNFWRLSQYITFIWTFNNSNKLSTTLYVQPSIIDIGNIRYYSEMSYDSKINKLISYKSTLTSKFYSNSESFDDIELFFNSGLEFKL